MKKILVTLSILLIARFAYSTDLYWQVNPSAYEFNMNVTASVYIDAVEQQDAMMEVGVFFGDELRGSALPRFSPLVNKYIYDLTIYSNDNCNMSFKIYDHYTNTISELTCDQILTFEANGTLGNAMNPYIIYFSTISNDDNVLHIPDVIATPSKTAVLPVYMDNTSEIVSVQFTIDVPDGMNLQTEDIIVGIRGEDHVVSLTNISANKYRCELYSPTNMPLRGYTGKLFEIEFSISNSMQNGSTLPMTLSDVILGDIITNNVMTSYNIGNLLVINGVDFIVQEVSALEQEIIPGETINISWRVLNDGGMPATGGWKEEISLINENGASVLLGTLYNEELLSEGSQISRSASLNVPQILGLDGDARIQIKLIANADSGENYSFGSNNTSIGDDIINVGKKLFLELPQIVIEENSTSLVKCKLSRSGDWTDTETFDLSKNDDARIELTSSVNITSGQSAVFFYIRMIDNDVIDNDSVVNISAIGDNYEAVASQLVLEDNEYPNLNIIASVDEITEGERFQLHISTEQVPEKPITIYLNSDYAEHFDFPAQVILPSDSESVTIDVDALDDDIANVSIDAIFTAYASRYNASDCHIELLDNDLPEIALELTPNTISESAGQTAVYATLKRLTLNENKVTVILSDDSDGRLYYSTQIMVLEPGVSEKQFTIGVIDNSLVDGEQEFVITASIYISSCNCSASGTTAGVVEQTLKVLDNDGPALSLSSSKSMLFEGSENATILTVTRNTDANEPLIVTISSDADDVLNYESTITIPADETSATLVVSAEENNTSSDNRTVMFTATADEYADGTCWAMITDRTLPDLIVSAVTPADNQIMAGDIQDVSISVSNVGIADCSAPIKVSLYLDNKELTTYYFQDNINPDASATMTKSVLFPRKVGTYNLYAVVNDTETIEELMYINNTSEYVPITLQPSFTADISTDKLIYNQEETVNIYGEIYGHDIANAEVDVYIINKGLRQVIEVVTDSLGQFSTEWQPYSGQIGHFSIGACYPDENLSDELTGIDIYGLKRTSDSYITCNTYLNEPYNGTIELYNPSQLPLTDVNVEVVSAPEHCSIETQIQSAINADDEAVLSYTITSNSVTSGYDYEEIKLRVTTAEQAYLDIVLYHYCYLRKGLLVANIEGKDTTYINTTMIKGASRDYSFSITNIGKGETGKITLALPDVDWMKAATPAEMSSLAYGESATIVLRLTPTDDMQLNNIVTGCIGINCENGNGIAVDFSIETVSESTGVLTIDVCDEYTYNTVEAPHVAGARVMISHPVTEALITEGITGDDGKFSIELPEGYYDIKISADNHTHDRRMVLLNPGREDVFVVNLSYKAITIGWEVEEAWMEDMITVTTVIEHETNVPMPIVELTVSPQSIPAKELADGESLIFIATLKNEGLITAQDAELILPEGFTTMVFEPLTEYTELDIPPQQSVTIPVKVTRTLSRQGHIDNDPCVGQPGTLYFWDCGLDRKWHRYGIALQVGSCNSDDPTTWDNSGNGSYGGGLGIIKPTPHSPYLMPGGTGGGSTVNGTTSGNGGSISTTEMKGCEPCQNTFLWNLVQCIPGVRQTVNMAVEGKKLWDCGVEFLSDESLHHKLISCELTKEAYEGALNVKEGIEKVADMLEYMDNLVKASVDINIDDSVYDYIAEQCKKALYYCLNELVKDKTGVDVKALLNDFDTLYTKLYILRNQFRNDVVDYSEVYKSTQDVLSSLSSLLDNQSAFPNLSNKVKESGKFMKKHGPCIIPLLAPCELGAEPANMKGITSPIEDFQNEMQYALNVALADEKITEEIFGDSLWLDVIWIERYFLMNALYNESDYIDPNAHIQVFKPGQVSRDDFNLLIERWNNSFILSVPASDNTINWDRIIELFDEIEINVASKNIDYDVLIEKMELAKKYAENSSESVCSSVSLQLSQTMTMTRQAFLGTLTVFNGHDSIAMQNVRLSLDVRDEYGAMVTSREFEIHLESLDVFEGDDELNADWSLAAGETGVAEIRFIPTKFAAPTSEMQYSFGGILSYINPFTNMEVTINLAPVVLTVKPSPNLQLTYFMQRDILGDDPLTTEVTEPMIPAEFSLLINNIGNGDANNVRMLTQQPKIVDNEKGLYIDFELLYSHLNGKETNLALGGNVSTDFDTIHAHSTEYAQWWLQSSLLGHFTDYDVKATHVNSYGNENLSLLDTITIHELIRSIKVNSEEELLTAFLVNDVIDAEDMPDALYVSDGTVESVCLVNTSTINKNSDTEYILTIYPSQSGWNYGSIVDPTNGSQEIIGIMRQSDGLEINLRNFWQTDRTLRDGNDPLYENRIHFIDNLGIDEESYLLSFADKPEKVLEVETFLGVPASDVELIEPLEEITVRFNKDIDAASFSADDITLTCQGISQDVSQIIISPLNDKEFKLNISELTAENGFYVLTVQTKNIVDKEGFNGKTGKNVSWIQYMYGTQIFMLENGWNWFSSYIDIDGEDGLNLIKNAVDDNCEQIKSQFAFAKYEEDMGVWSGDLETVSVKNMYMIKMSNKQDISIEGDMVNPTIHPISLKKNWTWFGYILNETMSIQNAFANFTPNDGDYVKSKSGFSQYVDGFGWFGDCMTFEPGQGYMYKNTSDTDKTLIYPMHNTQQKENVMADSHENHFSVNINQYPTSMCIIAIVSVNGLEISDYEIGAFCDDECRGSARPIYIDYLDKYLIFLTIHGNDNEKISFKYYDVSSMQECDSYATEIISFETNGSRGNMSEPYKLNFNITNVDEYLHYTFEVYPNPVDRNNEIYLGKNWNMLEVYNSIGIKVLDCQDVNTIDGLDNPGVYIIKASDNNSVKYCRLIVK